MKPNKIEISAWKSAVQQINWKNHVFTFRASCHFRNPRDSTLGSLVSQRAFQPRLDQSIFAVNLSMHGLVISFPRRSNRCLTSWETLVNFGQWTRPSRVTRGAFPASAFAPPMELLRTNNAAVLLLFGPLICISVFASASASTFAFEREGSAGGSGFGSARRWRTRRELLCGQN